MDGSGEVTPQHVLLVINYINANFGSTALPASPESPPRYYDVAGGPDGDGHVTAQDVLAIINWINAHLLGPAEGGAGEPVDNVTLGVLDTALAAGKSKSPIAYDTSSTALASLSPKQASSPHRRQLVFASIPRNSGPWDTTAVRRSHRMASEQDSEALDAWWMSLDEIDSDLAADVAAAWPAGRAMRV